MTTPSSDAGADLVASGEAHLIRLPGTSWRVWRAALLRSAGFPIAGLDRFSALECAAVADDFLAGRASEQRMAAAFDEAISSIAKAVHDVAADPRFREAVAWQNPGAADAAAGVLRDGPEARRNGRRRRREEIIAKYWQRYTAKNDTIGFFGPMCWVTVDPEAPPVAGAHGPRLERDRMAFFERWALAALADGLAEDPEVKPWLPLALQAQLSVDGRELRLPDRPPQPLPAPTAALLARCDGRRSAHEVARVVLASDATGFRREADVYAQLEELVERGLVRWGIDPPMDLSAEAAVRQHLLAIGDPVVRDRAVAALERLCAARDAVAATRTPEDLATRMAELEATFVAITGRPARQRPGETYAGRTVCHLEAVRDLELTFGGRVLAALAPLEPLLASARWLTSAMAGAYLAALTELYEDLAAGGSPEVPFGQLWYLAHGLLFGAERPAEGVVAQFVHRWTEVLGLADLAPGTRRLHLTRQELAARVAEAFPADRPGWAAARIHSPDVHICAPSQEALARGELELVLGELHIGSSAFDTHFFSVGHPEPEALRAAMCHDVPGSRVEPLIPEDWPRNNARNAFWMRGPGDVQLGFAPAPGADPDRLLPVTALTVAPGDGGLVVRDADGRAWPLVEMFAGLLGIQAFDTWKLAGAAGHTPRVTVDGLVLVRECWRTTVGATGLTEVKGERERYLAARRWRRESGLPERVFVRVATEIKPCYVDLTSPLYVRILCNLLRGAKTRGGEEVELMVTEMLPTAEQAWLTDSEGRRYCSELRLQIRDEATAAG
jgi:hypothetical protein